MDVPSHAEVVALIDGFLTRQNMKPSRLGRDALGEPQFVAQVRGGRVPGLTTLAKLSEFIRMRDEELKQSAMASEGSGRVARSPRLNAGAR